jgi:hypothetical protein
MPSPHAKAGATIPRTSRTAKPTGAAMRDIERRDIT